MTMFQVHRAGHAGPDTLIGTFPDFPSAVEAFNADSDAWAILPAGTAGELAKFGNLYSIAPRYYDGMYVLNCGEGFSTLGFPNAERKARAVAEWAGLKLDEAAPGSPEAFANYVAAMSAGAEYARQTGKRCPAELTPALIPFEGKKVRVTHPDGEIERFRVGKSTGWMPCHLEIKGRADGGPAVYLPEGATVELDRAA